MNEEMKLEQIPIGKIHVGKRYRIDQGDIETLAQNIRDVGLLQPIGVDSYYNLIFGARRLEACGDILRWESIPCVVLKLNSILAGEYAENEFRKQFTATERVALGEALEREELKKHQGKRTAEPVEHIPQVPGEKTRSKIAKMAGFGNETTMRQAQRVVERGAPETIKAMDAGEISISAAAAIASQPKKDQAAIVAMPTDERRTVVRDIRKAKAEREKDEAWARDLRLFRGLYNAVHFLATFSVDGKETWAGLARVSAYKFSDELGPAIECLLRIKKEHPNEARKPRLAT